MFAHKKILECVGEIGGEARQLLDGEFLALLYLGYYLLFPPILYAGASSLKGGDELGTVIDIDEQLREGWVLTLHESMHEVEFLFLKEHPLLAAHQGHGPSGALSVGIMLDGFLDLTGIVLILGL